MMKRIAVALAFLLAAAVSVLAAPASAEEHPPAFPPHGHLLLIGAEIGPPVAPGPPYQVLGFKRCVELAAGNPVPLHAHHDRVHFGRAGRALATAGQFVVPLDPVFPGIHSCADLQAALPFPPAPAP
jgi:hypothetical protein